MRRSLPSLLVLGLLTVTGCAATEGDDDGDAAQAAIAAPRDALAEDVAAAFDAFDDQRSEAPFAEYYADGRRVEGCWLSPAGASLTPFQKAFYCSVPLELRVCNSVVLLTQRDAPVEQRYRGWLSCQESAERTFGSESFHYDEAVNRAYRAVMLDRREPSADARDRMLEAHRPRLSGDSFAVVLADILAGVAKETAVLAFQRFGDLWSSFTGAGGAAR